MLGSGKVRLSTIRRLADPVRTPVDHVRTYRSESYPSVVLTLAIWLRCPILALLIGACSGLLLLSPQDTLSSFAENSLKVMQDEIIGWLILVCGSFGALIALLVRTGRAALTLAKGRGSSLLMTFVLDVVIFVEDYLNALTMDETMKRVTDRFSISREKQAYAMDPAAAPICVLVPLSTWGLRWPAGAQRHRRGRSGHQRVFQAIPYMRYAWAAVVLVLLVAVGLFPDIGPMREAELQACHGSAGAMHVGELGAEHSYAMKSLEEQFEGADKEGGKLHNFPVALVIGALMSASAFGSQACFCSDSTVLAVQKAGCNLIGHAVTQLPYTAGCSGAGIRRLRAGRQIAPAAKERVQVAVFFNPHAERK